SHAGGLAELGGQGVGDFHSKAFFALRGLRPEGENSDRSAGDGENGWRGWPRSRGPTERRALGCRKDGQCNRYPSHHEQEPSLPGPSVRNRCGSRSRTDERRSGRESLTRSVAAHRHDGGDQSIAAFGYGLNIAWVLGIVGEGLSELGNTTDEDVIGHKRACP